MSGILVMDHLLPHKTNPTHTYAIAGSYNVQLIVNTPKGCADTITQTIQITLPTADAGADLSLCLGASTPIGGSPTSTSPGATFAWSPSVGLNNTTIANPTANPVVNTTYTVTVNGCKWMYQYGSNDHHHDVSTCS